MTTRFADRVAEAVAAPSAGAAFAVSAVASWTVVAGLSGAYQSFKNIPSMVTGDTVLYAAYDGSGSSEVGLGTYSSVANTLTRTTIIASSNSNAACSFVGTVIVFNVVPALYFMPAVVAAAGTTQGTATVLTSRTNIVTSGTGGVILNYQVPTRIINRSGVAIFIYPQTGAQIEAYGTNAAAPALANGASVTMEPTSATQWWVT